MRYKKEIDLKCVAFSKKKLLPEIVLTPGKREDILNACKYMMQTVPFPQVASSVTRKRNTVPI